MGLVKRKIVFFYDFLPGSTTFVLWRTAKTWMQPSTETKDTFEPSNETVFDEKTAHGRKQMYKWSAKRPGERSFVQPLRRFAPAPLVGEPLASRWWSCWTSEVFCNRERPGSAVSIHDCLPRLKAFFINFRKRLAKYRQKRYNSTRSSFYRCKALDICLFSSVG